MSKGLTLTLMTVAVAMWGIQAMAEAPVISELPSPIVGSAESVTGSTAFVYPDAFDLTQFVSDDNTATADVKWSYELASPAKYSINGVEPINSASDGDAKKENPDTGTPNKRIDTQDLDTGTASQDANAKTITIRNIDLIPIGTTDPGSTPGVIAAQTQQITLYASDGTTYSSKTMFVYTDNGGSDRLSRTPSTPVIGWDYEGNTDGFQFVNMGGVTTGTSGSTAVCMTVAAAGDNWGWWAGAMSDIPLVLNAVYHIRATVTCSQASPGATPLWDMYLNNYDGTQGLLLYGADMIFYDSEGGANSAITTAKDYHLWWTPMSVSSAAWNDPATGAKSTANEANNGNKVGLVFRVLDMGTARADLNCANQSGTLCLTDASVERFALGDMVTVTPDVYSNTNFVPFGTGGTIAVTDLLGSGGTITYTGGVLKIVPSAASANTGLFNIDPAGNLAYDLGSAAATAQFYPVPWNAGELLQITAELTAPDSNAETNPPDAILMGIDTPGNEVLMQTYITRNGGKCGMPKQTDAVLGAYVPYMAFVYTHAQSVSTKAWYKAIRPRLTVLNNLGVSGTGVDNTGAFQCRSLKVNKVRF
jgi:hypothetical protein